ncbi:MAG: hypothetical protein FWD73_12225 [Polyangiaceae bacterium]|nr:hypothetical protein [Polyangiaceae bacterium]
MNRFLFNSFFALVLSSGIVLACGSGGGAGFSVDSSKKFGDMSPDEKAQACQDLIQEGIQAWKETPANIRRGYCNANAASVALDRFTAPTDEDVQTYCAQDYQSCMAGIDIVTTVDNPFGWLDGNGCIDMFDELHECTLSDFAACGTSKSYQDFYASWANWDCSQLKASDEDPLLILEDSQGLPPECEPFARCVSESGPGD